MAERNEIGTITREIRYGNHGEAVSLMMENWHEAIEDYRRNAAIAIQRASDVESLQSKLREEENTAIIQAAEGKNEATRKAMADALLAENAVAVSLRGDILHGRFEIAEARAISDDASHRAKLWETSIHAVSLMMPTKTITYNAV